MDVFGGARAFAVKVRTMRDLHRSVGEGIRYRGFEAFLERYGMTAAEIAPVLDVPSRTLARRKMFVICPSRQGLPCPAWGSAALAAGRGLSVACTPRASRA